MYSTFIYYFHINLLYAALLQNPKDNVTCILRIYSINELTYIPITLVYVYI